ncbi:hypothetical protein [Halorubrum distributum]|uniref:hypothetical protein n=1 Tax=Halorubrum distributum TaxID=29283 RepID=UPI002954FADE|nr:hypothetical protein [Halorubrum distributum]
MPREHGDDGTYVETVPLGRVLEVFDTVEGPVILSADVADELECSRETARRKLQQLHDRGDLARRKVSRRVIYWRAEGSDTFDAQGLRGDPETTLADESGESDARAAAGGDGTDGPADPPADAHGAESEHTTGVIDLGALSFDRDLTDARRSHLEAWIRHATGAGSVSKSDFEDWWTEVRADETGYNARSFWEAFAKAAMKQSDQFTKPNNRTYRYTGEVDS